jgi:hypothetical protein
MAFCRNCGVRIDDSAPKCPKCGAPQGNSLQRKWLGWLIGLIVISIVAGIGIPAYKDYQRRSQEAAAVKEEEDARLAAERKRLQKGILKIWVPAGFVGDDYWIYLNGHIENAPPHSERHPIKSMTVHQREDGGWYLGVTSDSNGSLIIKDGDFETNRLRSYIDQYIDSASGDAQRLFYPVDFPLESGNYTVEVAYLSKDGHGYSSFPFAITRKYIANVQNGQSTHIYVGVPNGWSDFQLARAAPWACSILPDELATEMHIPKPKRSPNDSGVSKDMERYLSDPVVQTLRASVISPSKDIVVLNFPEAQGGTREFDAGQIRYIANAVLENYHEPSHEDVAKCKESNPQFSQSYDEYDKIISDFETQLQYFHALAGT